MSTPAASETTHLDALDRIAAEDPPPSRAEFEHWMRVEMDAVMGETAAWPSHIPRPVAWCDPATKERVRINPWALQLYYLNSLLEAVH